MSRISGHPVAFRAFALALAVMFATPLPPFMGGDRALAATDRYVANTGFDVGACTNSVTPCQTINYAIGQSSPGDTIHVAAGTYPELVGVNKSLTLKGEQTGADARSRVASESIVTGNSGTTAFYVTANDVTIDGFTVQGNTNVNQFGAGIVLGGGTSGAKVLNNIIQNNIIGLSLANNPAGNPALIQFNWFNANNNPGASTGTGIYTDQFNAGGALANVTIDSNLFTANDDAGIDFSGYDTVNSPASDITISNNEFDGNFRAMLFFYTSSVIIRGNEMHDSTGDSADIRIFDGNTDFTITCNSITNGAGRGSRLSHGALVPFAPDTPSTNITMHYNNIAGNAVAGLVVDTGAYTGRLDAEINWWGSATGPTIASNPGGTGDAIVDPDGVVDYSPFLTSAQGQPCPPTPPAPHDAQMYKLATGGHDIHLGKDGVVTRKVEVRTKNNSKHIDTIRTVLQLAGLPTGCTAENLATGESVVGPASGPLVDETSAYLSKQVKNFDFQMTITCSPLPAPSTLTFTATVDHDADDYPNPDDDDTKPSNNVRSKTNVLKK